MRSSGGESALLLPSSTARATPKRAPSASLDDALSIASTPRVGDSQSGATSTPTSRALSDSLSLGSLESLGAASLLTSSLAAVVAPNFKLPSDVSESLLGSPRNEGFFWDSTSNRPDPSCEEPLQPNFKSSRHSSESEG